MTTKEELRNRWRAAAEIIVVFACVLGGIGLVAVSDLVGIPALRWVGAGLVIAGGVAIAVTSEW